MEWYNCSICCIVYSCPIFCLSHQGQNSQMHVIYYSHFFFVLHCVFCPILWYAKDPNQEKNGHLLSVFIFHIRGNMGIFSVFIFLFCEPILFAVGQNPQIVLKFSFVGSIISELYIPKKIKTPYMW